MCTVYGESIHMPEPSIWTLYAAIIDASGQLSVKHFTTIIQSFKAMLLHSNISLHGRAQHLKAITKGFQHVNIS